MSLGGRYILFPNLHFCSSEVKPIKTWQHFPHLNVVTVLGQKCKSRPTQNCGDRKTQRCPEILSTSRASQSKVSKFTYCILFTPFTMTPTQLMDQLTAHQETARHVEQSLSICLVQFEESSHVFLHHQASKPVKFDPHVHEHVKIWCRLRPATNPFPY